MKRAARIGAIIKILSDSPSKSFGLSYFCETLNAAKSSINFHAGGVRPAEWPEGQQRRPDHEQEDDDDLEDQGRDGTGAASANQRVAHDPQQ